MISGRHRDGFVCACIARIIPERPADPAGAVLQSQGSARVAECVRAGVNPIRTCRVHYRPELMCDYSLFSLTRE